MEIISYRPKYALKSCIDPGAYQSEYPLNECFNCLD